MTSEDLTSLSFSEQVLRVIESDPFNWYNCVMRKRVADRITETEFFSHKSLGKFRVSHFWRQVEHLGVFDDTDNHARISDAITARIHVRSMCRSDRRAVYRAFMQWRQRAMNLNALPLSPGGLLYGP